MTRPINVNYAYVLMCGLVRTLRGLFVLNVVKFVVKDSPSANADGAQTSSANADGLVGKCRWRPRPHRQMPMVSSANADGDLDLVGKYRRQTKTSSANADGGLDLVGKRRLQPRPRRQMPTVVYFQPTFEFYKQYKECFEKEILRI